MNENTGQFRSTAFGGFHRQDVLNYLERITRENQARTEELTKELEEAQCARAQAEADCKSAQEQAEQDASSRQAMEEELSQTKKALEETTVALTEAQAQVEGLTAQVNGLEPEAASWRQIKDEAGSIEVSAHERAQITVQTARAQAAEIRAEGIRWILEIQDRCDRLKRELRASVMAAETELDTVRDAFARAQEDMEGIQSALSDLVAGAREDSF